MTRAAPEIESRPVNTIKDSSDLWPLAPGAEYQVLFINYPGAHRFFIPGFPKHMGTASSLNRRMRDRRNPSG